jgi:hypothetical protein
MTDIVKMLWDSVPELWKPWVGTLLFVFYVLTKIRSEMKSSEIKNLQTNPTIKALTTPKPKWMLPIRILL